MNRVIHDVGVCHWLLSLSVMFSRFIHALAGISTLPFYGRIIFYCMNIPHFVYPLTPLVDVCVISTFWLL